MMHGLSFFFTYSTTKKTLKSITDDDILKEIKERCKSYRMGRKSDLFGKLKWRYFVENLLRIGNCICGIY